MLQAPKVVELRLWVAGLPTGKILILIYYLNLGLSKSLKALLEQCTGLKMIPSYMVLAAEHEV